MSSLRPKTLNLQQRTPRSVDAFGKFGDRLAEWANADDVSPSFDRRDDVDF
jgi:hypothetical protein